MPKDITHDVVIVGGGPAGLSAALALGRARKRVLLCDAGPRRNAAATHVHNFLTRDGTPPEELRRLGREQLSTYPNVEVRASRVEGARGEKGSFEVTIDGATSSARRLLLCTGMIDERVAVDGFDELWGHAVFQCPYCHGWEHKGRPWGFLARDAATLSFALLLRGWSSDVTLFAASEVPPPLVAQLEAAAVRVVTEPIARLRRNERALEGVELQSGAFVPCEALFAHPPQRQVAIVSSLGLALDADGLVVVDPMTRETSRRGIYAAGDLTTRAQGAVLAAAAGMHAAAMLNHELTVELAVSGDLGPRPTA